MRWWWRLPLALTGAYFGAVVGGGFSTLAIASATHDAPLTSRAEVVQHVAIVVGAVVGLWAGSIFLTGHGRYPSALPTIAATVFLTPFLGWVPARVQARHARQCGLDERYYWRAFATTVVVTAVIGVGLNAVTAVI